MVFCGKITYTQLVQQLKIDRMLIEDLILQKGGRVYEDSNLFD